jgi:hypothetical protein
MMRSPMTGVHVSCSPTRLRLETRRFVQHVVGDADFADVVELSGTKDQLMPTSRSLKSRWIASSRQSV